MTEHPAEGQAPLLSHRDGPVATLTLNRPHVHNALNAALLAGLERAALDLADDPDVRVVVVTGAGDRSFCAGADLDELAGLSAEDALAMLSRGQRVFRTLETCGVPVLAAVNGLALGGGFELALASTFVLVSSRASFGFPESGLGLIPGYGGTQRLTRLVGRHATAHLMLTGARLDADRAYALGLAPVPPVPAGDLPAVTHEVAASIAARSPAASRLILRAVTAEAPLDAGLSYESALAAVATSSREAAEGVAAFRERRTPAFGPVGPFGPEDAASAGGPT